MVLKKQITISYPKCSSDSINPIEKYGCPNCDSEYKQDIEVCADCNELNMVYKSFDKNIYY